MKREKIIKDGKIVGLKNVFEAGDKIYEQMGEWIYLEKDATAKDYEDLINKVLQHMLKFIKDSGKVWDLEDSQFVAKTKEDYANNLNNLAIKPTPEEVLEFNKQFEGKIGTLGFKVVLSRIVGEGENLD